MCRNIENVRIAFVIQTNFFSNSNFSNMYKVFSPPVNLYLSFKFDTKTINFGGLNYSNRRLTYR